MKTLLSASLGLLLALCPALVPVADAQSRPAAPAAPQTQAQVWKLATGYRAESFHTRNIEAFAADVQEATRGALRIEVHPNNALFRLAEIRQAVQDGRAQAGETIMTSMAEAIPVAGADSIPFVVGSYEDAARLWALQRPIIERHMQRLGLQVLYAVPWPPQGLYSKSAVRGAADFKGSRMRTYNPTTVRIAQMLGAQPVDVPMVEVNRALAEGRIDSMITSAVTGVENQVWDHIRHYAEINSWFPKNIVFVNRRAFDALAPAAREAVQRAAREAEARGWTMSRSLAAESTRELRARGMKVERMPAEFEAELKRMGEKFSREWVRSVGNEANQIFVPYYFEGQPR